MSRQQRRVSLYLHIPFCVTKCNYCDFNTYAGIEDLMPEYVSAVVDEIGMWGEGLGQGTRVATIFFGGGTPSLLPVENVERILEACKGSFRCEEKMEVTLESNPGDLLVDHLEGLRGVGVNRLSIGVQSFSDAHLVALTRRHSAEEAEKAFVMARDAGFDNVNLDLMFGLPQQTFEEWKESVNQVISLGPEHLSLYALTLEEGTPLHRDVHRGATPEPDADLAAEMYLHAVEALGEWGYGQYEISNWAKPGRECGHNLVYWRNEEYLGIGAGAHSFLGGCRFSEERNPRRYASRVRELRGKGGWGRLNVASGETLAEALQRCGPVSDVEVISGAMEMGETMMMGLRLMEGVSGEWFQGRFGCSLESVFGTDLKELSGLGLLEIEGDRWRLTGRGRLLGNEVFQRFVSVRA